ncbi:ABC transporter ATP-binding protein [Entomospira culicis]|uniref:ABC transporter ATP-binding protein n=2 Tax=Entomospira culicis TaxID=2719989 RepID=A0A968GHU5_9SPIO|nr:ABC transporter ATP-binding protein [Entomospira culicis]NIZ19932.1 ABC transporter ATP-binding protein [Entomospira culicis]NIZ70111.1 ABC transporter ATP-binding protein [Entomospira culicis]WDI38038.1 ABC transporter ATP-binding protein [Entomospira culicis]WDI39661.1 ABC transporter ATP-binding protein [Entomospira culicis]
MSEDMHYCSDEEAVVVVEKVSKKFTRSLRRSLLYASVDILQALMPIFSPKIRDDTPVSLRTGEFLALDKISFRLKKGDSLALLGVNGSGKTTLLRLIYGIYPFDRGRIEVRGRIGALLAAGVGFHPQMTGRENIYVNGAILGMSKEEIDRHFDDILQFADIAEFIDAPSGTYSSGMRVRLGFSIVIHADVDVLIADEVLAVGDGAFREKCFTRIDELKARGVSIIFVSHALNQVSRVCEKSLYLQKGKMIAFGDTEEILALYMADNPGV